MSGVTIRRAGVEDAAEIALMLARLAADLGDAAAFSSTPETIRQFGFGPGALFHCAIAEEGGLPVGLALYFAHFSTTRGQPGAYVQDLWVESPQRGTQLGQRLLRAVARHANQAWGGVYVALSVHADNEGAARFYRRLGFEAQASDRPHVLKGPGFQALLAVEEDAT